MNTEIELVEIETMLETKATFSEKVLAFCDENELSLIEGLVEFISTRGIEVEDVSSLLTNELKALIHKEAVDLNMFRHCHRKVQFDD
jgi:hypothetical protein